MKKTATRSPRPTQQWQSGLLSLILLSAPALATDTGVDTLVEADDANEVSTQAKKPGYHTTNFRFRPSLSLTETYDDNIFATDTGETSDWISVLSPQLRVDSTWPEHSLKFNAGAEIGRYKEYDAENYQDYWVNLEGRYNATDTIELFGGLGMASDHEGRDSPEAEIAGQSPTTYSTLSAHAGVKTVFDALTLRTGATFERVDFDNVPAATGLLINDDRDRDLFGLGARLSYALTEQDQVFLQALYDRRDYDLGEDIAGFDRDSDGYRAAVGFISKFGGGNKAEAYVGVLEQNYEDDRFDTVRKPDFGGKLTLRPTPATKITANLQRALNETTLTGSPGYFSTSLAGKIEYRVTPRFIPYASVAYEVADYLQSARDDDSLSAEAGLKYFLTRNTYLVTGVRHYARDSNDADRVSGSNDFTKNTLFLTFATQGYPLFEPYISKYRTEGEIDVGVLSLSDDALFFGRYNGLGDEGVELNGDVDIRSTDGESGYARFKGENLGLDNRSLEIGWGSQGAYDTSITYRQIPFRQFSGRSIFDGIDSDQLSLPDLWVSGDSTADMTNLTSSLKEVEIGTMRKRLAAGTKVYASDNRWTAKLSYQTESQEGLRQTSGMIGTSPGNGRSVLLPEPVDYTTNTLDASLGFNGEQTQMSFAYHGSFFYDSLETLKWESPFDATGPRGTDGAIALPPDNQFHQLSVSGVHALSNTTHVTGIASVGVMLQDEDFLPDTVDPALTAHNLPRSSLDGEIYLYNASLAVTSRPLRGLDLKASYRMQKRDNQTSSDSYTYYVNDSFGGLTNSPQTSTNQPYSYDKRTAKLHAGYRLHRKARLSGEVSRETMERSPSEVDKTTEDQGKLKLRLSALDNLHVSLSGGLSSRTGSDYEPIAGENPLLRKYNISDRDRKTQGLDISWQPTDRLALSANLSLSDDDYDDTRVGLRDAQSTSLTLDAAYNPNQDLTTYAFIGREIYESHQAGSQVPDEPDWFVRNEDTVDSIGLGVRWKKDYRTEIGADYVLSDSTGKIDIRSNNTLPPVTPFPDLKAKQQSLRLYAEREIRKNTKLRLDYRYEKYDADDWSIDGVNADSIPEVLLLDEDNPSYDQHIIGLSISVRF